MSNVMPAAVLLDFDGTLVDTEPFWMQGEVDLLTPMGVPWTLPEASVLSGTSKENSIDVLFAQMAAHGVDTSSIDPEVFYEQLFQKVIDAIELQGAPWLPGVVELLADLKANNIPCGIVSSSPASVLDAGLKQFPPGVISVVVDGQMVSGAKPEPDAYLLAAQLLGVAPSDCIVLEDTLSGTTAGLAAGAVVIAIPREAGLADVPGQVILDSLEGVDVARLRQIFREVRQGK